MSILLALFVLFSFGVNVEAGQEQKIGANVLLIVLEETNIYKGMNMESEVMISLSKGTPIFSKGEAQGQWILVNYQDITGYVQVENICIYGSEELEAEFEQIANWNELLINELEYIYLQQKNETMWTMIIVALVIAIFSVGFVTAAMKNVHDMENKRKKGKNRKKETDTDI